jgi:hypothetical protein
MWACQPGGTDEDRVAAATEARTLDIIDRLISEGW